MNSRLVISLVVAGALAFACGPRTRGESASVSVVSAPIMQAQYLRSANTQSVITQLASTRSRSKANARNDAHLQPHFDVHVVNHAVQFALNVTNVGPKHVELNFPSGQAYDFVVLDSIGREIWQWSSGRMFTQTVQNKQLASGESLNVAEKWTPLAHGAHYVAVATLHSSNFPIEQRVTFVAP
jgi:intracellular proteinase inhibitor BsuPI